MPEAIRECLPTPGSVAALECAKREGAKVGELTEVLLEVNGQGDDADCPVFLCPCSL